MAKQQRIDPRNIERTRAKQSAARSGNPAKRAQSAQAAARARGPVRPATLGTWIAASRPQTLALAIAPVALGTGAAALLMDSWTEHWVRALLALAVAVGLQIGVNYANDYSDGVRGTDRDRVGPARLVGSGRAQPRQVLTVALVFFALSALAGLVLVWRSEQWWLLAVGAVSLLAAWFYTGGKWPYGYLPLGELAVLIFFGFVPVAGTMLVQAGTVNIEAWLGGAALGCFAAAVLLVNNLRDRERDALHSKRTLSVIIGATASKALFTLLILVPYGILAFFVLFYEFAPYVYFSLLAAAPALLIVWTAKTARELVIVLQLVLVTSLTFGIGLAAAIGF